MDQIQTAPGIDAGQARALRIISNSGRATRFLGFFYFVMSFVGAFSFWKLISLLNANAELGSALAPAAKLAGMPWFALVAFVVMLSQSLFLFFTGTYIQKNLTKDTVLYLKIVLAFTIVALAIEVVSGKIGFDFILYVVLLYYVIRGLISIKQVAIDSVARDPKRVFVFAFISIVLVVPVVMQFVVRSVLS